MQNPVEEWGPRPGSLGEAQRLAGDLVAAAPQLIPIYGHRMMPDEPHLAGNPVFSVHQTDIIIYGVDLANYLHIEFGLPGDAPHPEQERPIRFWDLDRFQAPLGAGWKLCVRQQPRAAPVANLLAHCTLP
jgi:hypothetical protein